MSAGDVRRSTWATLAVFVTTGVLYGIVRPDEVPASPGVGGEPVAVVVVTTTAPTTTTITTTTPTTAASGTAPESSSSTTTASG